jgi:hypothetical protein
MSNKANTQISNYATQGKPSSRRQPKRFFLVLALGILALASQSANSYAQNSMTTDSVSLTSMSGSWVISLVGVTGCGQTTLRALATLGTTGKSSSTSLVTHSSTCGNATSAETFDITGLQSTGTGTAHLSCGDGCGWDFDIQVASGNNVFNLVDVTNGENYLAGVAIRKQ